MNYYDLTSITRSASDAEEDAFLHSDIDAFLDQDVEARSYCLYSEDEKEDNLSDAKAKIKKFKDTLLIRNGKGGEK